MERIVYVAEESLSELAELLDTACFSLETVQMALAVAGPPARTRDSLEARLDAEDEEEREAGQLALDALDTARAAFLELADRLERDPIGGLGLAVGFWSTFEWCWNRLFTDPVRQTSHVALVHEIAEARRRTERVHADIERHTSRQSLLH